MKAIRHRLALGYKAIFLDAVLRHQKDHAGKNPLKLVMSEAVFQALVQELGPAVGNRLAIVQVLYGVPIQRTVCSMPYMLTSKATVEWV